MKYRKIKIGIANPSHQVDKNTKISMLILDKFLVMDTNIINIA